MKYRRPYVSEAMLADRFREAAAARRLHDWQYVEHRVPELDNPPLWWDAAEVDADLTRCRACGSTLGEVGLIDATGCPGRQAA